MHFKWKSGMGHYNVSSKPTDIFLEVIPCTVNLARERCQILTNGAG